MRSLRAFLFLCVGLYLGGFSVFAFAAAADYGRSMRLNAPESSRARFTGAPIYEWADAPSGWGRMKDINKINIGSKSFDVTGGRLFSPQTLAKGAVSFVRFGGPAWIGFMLAGLVWDEVTQRWLKPADGQPHDTMPGTTCPYDIDAPYQLGTIYTLANGSACQLAPSAAHGGPAYPAGWTLFAGYFGANDRPNWGLPADGSFWVVLSKAQYVPPDADEVPATDQELEDAIYVELVARGMGSDLARRLIKAGYKPQVDSIDIDGPSSIPGDTVTSTTSGPAGTTITTTNTTHNISYTTNTTNNTSTVTITNVSTTTTTAPDGTTTTETTETAPEGSTEPPPEEKPFCELYPEASACAKLDVPPVDPNESEDVNVTLKPTGGFGAEGGSCPPPYPFVVQGRSYQISYAQACDFFSAVRPVVIAAAMLSALLIALGGYKRD